MSIEIEVKVRAPSLAAVRQSLKSARAKRVGSRFEVNAFFDTPDRAMKVRGEGLRLRSMRDSKRSSNTSVITFKGPRESGEVSRREEIEFEIGDFDDAAALLGKLGYERRLGFEKRRETWMLDGCLVELDELPYLGTFVEIEGDSDSKVLRTLKKLGLSHEEPVVRGYISMIDKLVREQPKLGPTVRFPKRL
jgi:adenylate cyclase, class 2